MEGERGYTRPTRLISWAISRYDIWLHLAINNGYEVVDRFNVKQ